MNEANPQGHERVVTWIIVADSTRARVLESIGGPSAPSETDVFERVDVTIPANGYAGAGVSPINGSQYDAFAQAVSRYLAMARAGGQFSRLILIAPEPMLHRLHGSLPPEVRASIDLLAEADLMDAEPETIIACLPGRMHQRRHLDA